MCGLGSNATAEKPKKGKTGKFKRTKGDGLHLNLSDINEDRWIYGDGCKIVVCRIAAVLQVTGDGCQVQIGRNEATTLISGDGCRIVVEGNEGLLRVTGDGCQVIMGRNPGTVEYLGDGGLVTVDSEIDTKRVTYKGHGGRVEVGGLKHRKKNGDKPRSKVRASDVNKTRRDHQETEGKIYVSKSVNGDQRINVNLSNATSLRINFKKTTVNDS